MTRMDIVAVVWLAPTDRLHAEGGPLARDVFAHPELPHLAKETSATARPSDGRNWRIYESKDVAIESAAAFTLKPAGMNAFMFPRTIARIDFREGHAVTANPTAVLMLNRQQHYTTHSEGRIPSVQYLVSDAFLLRLLAPFEKQFALDRPFRFLEAAPPAATLMEERILFDAVAAGDRIGVEERLFGILSSVLQTAYGRKKVRTARKCEIEGVETVREWISRNPSENPSLAYLSGLSGLSPVRLCRAFRRRTGLTLTQFRHTLRGCLALDIMTNSKDLLKISLALGYSSHSHFTYTFRRIFGEAPSSVRRRFCGY